jgi:hypothetical protein
MAAALDGADVDQQQRRSSIEKKPLVRSTSSIESTLDRLPDEIIQQ